MSEDGEHTYPLKYCMYITGSRVSQVSMREEGHFRHLPVNPSGHGQTLTYLPTSSRTGIWFPQVMMTGIRRCEDCKDRQKTVLYVVQYFVQSG
jgi:hypothetical protein